MVTIFAVLYSDTFGKTPPTVAQVKAGQNPVVSLPFGQSIGYLIYDVNTARIARPVSEKCWL